VKIGIFLTIILGLSGVVGCTSASLPAKKAHKVACPAELPSDEADRPLAGMAISSETAVVICGHREDMTLAKRMRVSDFAVAALNVATGAHETILKFSPLDQKFVQLFPKKKQFEVISVVLRSDEKPIAVMRDLYDCGGGKCQMSSAKCVFKSDLNRDFVPISKIKDVTSWWRKENQDARLQQLYLAALSGHVGARKMFDEFRGGRLSADGAVGELFGLYAPEELRARTACSSKGVASNHQ
jgi:hypothetical protein